MKAQIVPVIVFVEDDGKVSHIAFSESSAEVILAITYEYAQDDADGGEKKRQEVREAREVVRSANLPKENTPADGHYCAVSGMAEGLRLTEEQLLKRNDDAVPKELYPGFALCCFVRGGRHGLRLAFSREVAKQLYDEPVPAPFSSLEPHRVDAVKGMIDDVMLPFPNARIQLDDEFESMLTSLAKVHR